MREGETLKTYSNRYWEMFNEIDNDFDDAAIKTFKVGLPAEHGLRKSLTEKLVISVRQLIDQMISIKGSRRTNSKARVKVRSSPRREEISGQTTITITDLRVIFLGSLGP